MSDLISRRAAIDAINTWPKYGVDERNRIVPWYEGLVPYVHLEDVVKAIVGLPSAQPEIIRCKDCRWGRKVCGNIECFADTNVPPEYHGYEWFCPNGERRTDEPEK